MITEAEFQSARLWICGLFSPISFIAVCTVYISLNRSLVLSFASGS